MSQATPRRHQIDFQKRRIDLPILHRLRLPLQPAAPRHRIIVLEQIQSHLKPVLDRRCLIGRMSTD